MGPVTRLESTPDPVIGRLNCNLGGEHWLLRYHVYWAHSSPHGLYRYPDNSVIPGAHSAYTLEHSQPPPNLFATESSTTRREDVYV